MTKKVKKVTTKYMNNMNHTLDMLVILMTHMPIYKQNYGNNLLKIFIYLNNIEI